MHELALTEGIIDIIRAEAKKNGFTRCLAIRLRVGEYAGVLTDCLRDCFAIASAGTLAEGAVLQIESIPAAFACPVCRWQGRLEKHADTCPDCGSTAIRMTAGREFYVEDIKVES